MTETEHSNLSLVLRAGTFWRLSKCTFYRLTRHPSLSAIIISPLCSVFCPTALYFPSLSGVCTSMSSPCVLTCTPGSTRSGFTSGSGTWRLERPTASQSSTWWRAAACILREWDRSSILRGPPKKRALDGDALVPTSDTSAAAVR